MDVLSLMWMLLLLVVHEPTCSGKPIKSCPYQPQWFVADTGNRCIYYWCKDGRFLPRTFYCATGSRVRANHYSDSNPCTYTYGPCVVNGRPPPFPAPTPKPTTTTTTPPTTTTTTTTTSTTTPKPTPLPDITYNAVIVEGAHVLGGEEQPGLMNISVCFSACLANRRCKGFDFNRRTQTCYFHTHASVCGTLLAKVECVHYRFAYCPIPYPTTTEPTTTEPTTTTTTTTSTATTPPLIIPYVISVNDGGHKHGGTLVYGIHNHMYCLAACTGTCAGVDWDSARWQCYLHGPETECSDVIPKDSCTHFRIRDVCIKQKEATTSNTESPTFHDVYEAVFSGVHIPNGYLIDTDMDKAECLKLCMSDSHCLAVDYNSWKRTCRLHGQHTYCDMLEPEVNCTHYKQVPCQQDGALNVYVEVRHAHHVFGGVRYCIGCPLSVCLKVCAETAICQGVDYNLNYSSCHQHEFSTVCSTTRPKDGCRHFRKIQC